MLPLQTRGVPGADVHLPGGSDFSSVNFVHGNKTLKFFMDSLTTPSPLVLPPTHPVVDSGVLQPWVRALVENRGYVKPPLADASAPRALRDRATLKARRVPTYWELYGKDDATAAMQLLQTSLTRRACDRMIKLLPAPLAVAAEIAAETVSVVGESDRLARRYASLAARILARDFELRAGGGEGLPAAVVQAASEDPSKWLEGDDEIDLTADEEMAPPPKRVRRASTAAVPGGSDDEEEEDDDEDDDDDEGNDADDEADDDDDEDSAWDEEETAAAADADSSSSSSSGEDDDESSTLLEGEDHDDDSTSIPEKIEESKHDDESKTG